MTVWYHVRDLDSGRAFYRDTLRFSETYYDTEGRWGRVGRGGMQVALGEGEPDIDGAVAHVEVEDGKAEATRLREAGVEVGVVVELHGVIRLLDVFDPDGNRIQFAQDVSGAAP